MTNISKLREFIREVKAGKVTIQTGGDDGAGTFWTGIKTFSSLDPEDIVRATSSRPEVFDFGDGPGQVNSFEAAVAQMKAALAAEEGDVDNDHKKTVTRKRE